MIARSKKRHSVLIVDDDSHTLNMLKRMLSLEEDDYEIHLAKDAEEGLAIAIKNNSISLLIADFNLRTVSHMFSFHLLTI